MGIFEFLRSIVARRTHLLGMVICVIYCRFLPRIMIDAPCATPVPPPFFAAAAAIPLYL